MKYLGYSSLRLLLAVLLAVLVTITNPPLVHAAAITIGPGAIDRAFGRGSGETLLNLNAVADGTGTIVSFELWFNAASVDATGVKVGTFYGSGTSWTSRDYETIGNVAKGSKQTFSGLNCDVTAGDYPGIYFTAGDLERDVGGDGGYIAGDKFGAGAQTYTIVNYFILSIYGTGATPPVAPTVTTQAATDVLATSCTGNGTVSDNGTAVLTEKGICYKVGISGDPTTADSTVHDHINALGAYTEPLVGLIAGTSYRLRAYAINIAGTGYGATVQVTTTAVVPAVTTDPASSVEETTAILHGNVTAINDTSITDRGFVWDITSHGDPGNVVPAASGYTSSWIESAGYGVGIYSYNGGAYNKGILYYVRAWAKNDTGYYGYGNETTFLTKPDPPIGLTIVVTSSTQLTSAWTKGTGADRSMVRYKVGIVAPILITDGTQVYLGIGSGYGHTGLAPGQTNSYSVWSEVTAGGWTQYSDTYISGTATTSSMSIYLANFKYYIPITVTSSCSTIQELRIPFIINSAGLVSGGYVQADFDDMVLVRVDTLMPLTVTDITATTLWKSSEATSNGSTISLIDSTLTQADDYWNGDNLTITETVDGLAPQGESRIVSDYTNATDNLTFPALSAVTHDGDLYTVGNYRSKYFTNLTLAPYQQVVLKLYLGYAAAVTADREFCTDESDTITVADHADFDITDNLTVMATVKIFKLPGAVKTLVSKNGAYELGINASNKPYFRIWHGAATDNATGSTALIEDTEYILKGTYDNAGDNITICVDGSVAGSKADAAGAITTTDNVTVLMGLDNCEVDDIMIGRTSLTIPMYSDNFTMEAADITSAVLVDKSVSAHNANIMWDISLPSCVTVEVGAVTEVATWGAPGSSEAGEIGVFDLPTEPTNWMPTKTDFTLMPAYELIHAAGSGGGLWGGTGLGWSDATMYRIMVMFTAIGMGAAIGIATASALLTAIAVGVILGAGANAGIIGWWVVLIYGIFAMGYIVASRSM